MVDALVLEASTFGVWVRVPSSAPNEKKAPERVLFRLVQPTLRCKVAAAAGIPVRFAHSNVVGTYGSP